MIRFLMNFLSVFFHLVCKIQFLFLINILSSFSILLSLFYFLIINILCYTLYVLHSTKNLWYSIASQKFPKIICHNILRDSQKSQLRKFRLRSCLHRYGIAFFLTFKTTTDFDIYDARWNSKIKIRPNINGKTSYKISFWEWILNIYAKKTLASILSIHIRRTKE